jgi:RHS repeat-associated protein
MKIPILILGLIAVAVSGLEAQQTTAQAQVNQLSVPTPTPYAIVNQDANSRVWQRQEYEAGPNGQVISHIRHYTEMATGLNYKDASGNWLPAKEEIDIQPDGTAAATQAQHFVHFPIDIANGQIELVTPDGKQIFSEPEELTYFDGTNSVVLGEITNSVGVLVGGNQIIYPNAFSGIKASLRYTFTKAGFEQDVILLQQPLTPEYYGLNPEKSRMQMVTEFFNSPNASIVNSSLPNQAGISLTDQSVDFGVMRMGTGRAFLMGTAASDSGVLVAKTWLNISGRQFLVEEVPVNAIVQGLAALPLTAMNYQPTKERKMVAKKMVLPKQRLVKKGMGKIKLAALPYWPIGFVLDYQTINSSLTNWTFQNDTTYYISGIVDLFGTNTFEGGAVIKYTNNASLNLLPNSHLCVISWQGGAYRPIIFTSKDDNSIGDTISGATGSPTNCFASPALSLDDMFNTRISGFRISWAKQAISITACGTNTELFNGQIINCVNAITIDGAQPIKLRNVLFGNVSTNLNNLYSAAIDAQNCTFAGSAYLMTIANLASQSTGLSATNCLFVNVLNCQTNGPLLGSSYWLNGGYNGFYNSYIFGNKTNCVSVYPFQTVGDGHYYLSNICAFHNWGTTNIDPALFDALQSKTTHAPLVYSTGAVAISNNLGIYAQRDSVGNPDLGYHYDPLDYVFGGSDLYSNVTFSAGTAVGYHAAIGGVGSSGEPYGLSLNSGASFSTIGTAAAPCWVVDYNNVQEGTGSWADSGWMGSIMFDGNGSGATPQINSTFTKWGRPWALFFRDNWEHGEGTFNDCEFYGGSLATYDTSYLYFTNCLFYRPAIYGFDQVIAPYFTMLNCTYYNGFMVLSRSSSQSPAFWTIENTSFDGTGIYFSDNLNGSGSATLFNFNAYNTNNLSGLSFSYPYGTPTNVLEVVGPSDQKISGYNWQSSWFGGFYLPTNSLIMEKGSTSANLLGLYHYTTQPCQTVEGTNIVTIGYHYVATDTNGLPLDSNGDGIPDYLEDANGDGMVDNGETNWALAILGQPLGQTNFQGANVTFAVAAQGVWPLHYQWFFNSSNLIIGASNAFLTLSNIQPAQAGSYSVVVTNQFGSIGSSNAMLVVNPTSFDFSNFCEVTNLQLNGTAAYTNTGDGCVLELTPAAYGQAGSAFLKIPVALSGNASFSTFFSFRLSNSGGVYNSESDNHIGADGIVFVLQTSTADAYNNSGGGIGYWGITNSVGVVFDTWWNDGAGNGPLDPTLAQSQNVLFTTNAYGYGTTGDGNHVGVVYDGFQANAATLKYGITNTGCNAVSQHIMDDLNNSNIWYAWIDYNGAISNLQIRVSETNSRPFLPTLTNTVNLLDFLGQTNVYVGFTAGTGGAFNQQDILSWQINLNYNPIGATNQVSVAIISPANQTFIARTNVLITAVASNSVPNQPLNAVEFFDGTNSIGYAVSTNTTFQLTWIPITSGPNVLTAFAFNTNGASGWSAPVTNTVLSLPTVEISTPVDAQIFSIFPTNLNLTATATAYGTATITNVAYLLGTNIIGSSSGTAPYAVSWSVATNGYYPLHAVATDSLGHVGISSNIIITMEPRNQPPFVNAGPNQTNFFTTNAVQLEGAVSDDGLPLNHTLTVSWVELSGPTNATFINSNLPVTGVSLSAPGNYVLQLSANDGQFQVSNKLNILILPTNQPPLVNPGTNQTIVLPAVSTNIFGTLYQTLLPNNIPSPTGIDYFGESNCVVASVNFSTGNPFNFELVSASGNTNQFSSLSNFTDEVYISAVRSTIGGFKVGEMFTGNGVNGEIMRIEPDGTTIGTNAWEEAGQNVWHSNAWVVLPSLTLTNGSSVVPGLLRGGLWVDRTGVWGGDLIVCTEEGDGDGGNYDPSPVGYVWRINSKGRATFVAQMDAQPDDGSGLDHFEGVTTCPNDSQKYGPLAGCILVGGDYAGDFFAINTNGFVVRYDFPFGAEDIRIVPQNENFFGCLQSGGIFGIPASQFSGMVGDLLVCDENTTEIYRLQWNGQEFETYSVLANPPTGDLEGANFAPAGLFTLPSAGWVQLAGAVSDDGELFSSTSNTWSVVSGPTNAQTEFSDSELTNSTVNFSVAGTYVLKLSAFDGEYTTSSNITITVIQNRAPWVFAGTNQFIYTNTTVLQGVVTNLNLPPPYNLTNIVWNVVGGPPVSVFITSSNQAQTSITFDTNSPGAYVLCLTADDGQATNSAYVTINVLAPANILSPPFVITPTNQPATLTVNYVNQTNGPIANSLIQYQFESGPNQALPAGYILTDSNGVASLTYADNVANDVTEDVIKFSSSNFTGVAAYVTNCWGYSGACGDQWLGQQLSQNYSIEPWSDGYHYADYFNFNDNAGDVVQFALTSEPQYGSGPLIMYLHNSSNQIVAISPATQSGGGPSSSALTYVIPATGQYTLEVASIDNINETSGNSGRYDLNQNCADYTNPVPQIGVVYGGTNIPSGGTVMFPSTPEGSRTNINLAVTNAGNFAYEITNVMYGGDFSLTNDLTGKSIAAGGSANLGVVFNANSNETSLGYLVLSANYPGGSNYVVYFEASTASTGAVPVIQLTCPANGSTWLDQYPLPLAAVVTPGSAEINPASVYATILNGLSTGNYSGYGLTETGLTQVYTNTGQITGSIYYNPAGGDYTFSATVADQNGVTATAPTALVHILPFYSLNPLKEPAIQIVCNGTNVANGGDINFPQTGVGVSTNLTLVISNAGDYPLGIGDYAIGGSYTTPSLITPCVLLPGATTNFEVTFAPVFTGENAGQLVFSDNVPGGGKFIVYLNGNVATPGSTPPNNSPMLPVATNQTFTVRANSQYNPLQVLLADYLYDTNAPLTVVAVKPTSTSNGGTVSIINNGSAIAYTPPAGFESETIGGVLCPADGFSYEIQDANGNTSWGSILIYVYASAPPGVSIVSPPNGYATNAGAVVPIVALVTNSLNIADVQFYQGEQLLGTVTNGSSGYYTTNWVALDNACGCGFTAQAYDTFGQVSTSPEIYINVTPPTGVEAPVAAFDTYAGVNDASGPQPFTNSVVVTDGIFNLYGRAFQPQGSNVLWQLNLYSEDGRTLLRNLLSTNLTVGSSSISNILLKCDLSAVQNGVYDLVLNVSGGFMESETNVQFILNSNLKIGRFSFSQQDLMIPVNGIPLKVVRTYDSLNPNKGDFGYGWTYELVNMSVSLDETRQDAVDVDGDQFSKRAGGSWDVTLTLPNGQTTTFAFHLAGPDTFGSYEAQWQAPPGVTAKLVAQGDSHLETLVASLADDVDLYYWDATGPGTPWQDYDFPGFILTTQDGTQYFIKRQDLGEHFMDNGGEGYYLQAFGQPYLAEIHDRNTNTVTIAPQAIVFKSAAGATSQITFQRNADGLITSVSDPNAQANNGPPTVQYQYDSQDNLVSVLNLVNASTGAYVTNTFSYTNAAFPHYITGIINADGSQVAENFYDDAGKLAGVQDANGNLTRFIHNETNNSEVIIDRLNYTNTYVYDARGNIIAQTNQLGQVTTMAYDANNNKTQQVEFLNGAPYATNSYVYDTNLNLMVSATDPLGHSETYAYDAFGNLTSSVDARGHGTTNLYDAGGNLIVTLDALGHGTTNLYSGSELLGSVDAVGNVTTNYYDPATSYLVSTATLDAQNNLLSSNTYAYDANGNRTNSTVWRQVSGGWTNAETSYVYDALNRVVQTIDPDGGTNAVSYDPAGRQQTTTDPLDHKTTYAYDPEGRLLETDYPDGTATKSLYDPSGNRITSTDQSQRVTTYVYDGLNRLVETIYPDQTTNATVYDGVGRQAQTIDARGIVTAFAYDPAGRRLAVTNALGTSVASTNFYSYDNDGNQITFTDGLGHTTTNVFDVLNRQVATEYADGTSMFTGYDADGRRTAETNQDGVVTWFGYDGAGRLLSLTNAVGSVQQTVTQYRYDQAGNEIAQIDALGRTNVYVYDGMGRRVAHTMPGGQVESFTYDLAGNLTFHTNFNNPSVVCNLYNEMNRLTNTFDGGNYFNDSFTYTATGQRQSSIVTEGTVLNSCIISSIYDIRDRLMSKQIKAYSQDLSVVFQASLNYGYDANGNLTNMKSGYANGVQLTYAYDQLNRLTNVLSYGQPAASYRYDLVGNLQGIVYGNGVTNRYQYDSLNRLTNLVWRSGSASLASFAYQIKPGGTRTNLVETNGFGANGVSYAWSYDNLYRLTNEVIGGFGQLGYGYDPVGNRTNRASSVAAFPAYPWYGYDTNDELTAVTSLGNFTYDSDGNTYQAPTTNGSVTCNYDGLNRMVSYGSNLYLAYDQDGNRIAKESSAGGNSITFYLVDDRNPTGYAQVMEEYTVNGSGASVLSRAYNYGLNLISQQQFNTNTLLPSTLSYYGYDGHGNVRFLMDTNGTITDRYTYDAFGNLIASTGSTPNNYLYCGQQWDPDLGLYYNRARYLNTDTGRFWTSDTTEGNNEDPLSLHKYLYAEDDSIDGIDPTGHDWLSSVIFGNIVHQKLGDDFTTKASDPQVDERVDNILTLPKKIPVFGALRPDLVDRSDGEVYEIKPAGLYLQGRAQLQLYTFALNYFDTKKRNWHAGANYKPKDIIEVTWGVYAIIEPPQNGVILYETINIPLIVGILAEYTASQVASDVATATLIDATAGFAF